MTLTLISRINFLAGIKVIAAPDTIAISTDQAVGITFALTTAVMLSVGSILGALITYCLVKNQRSSVQQRECEAIGHQECGPMYEDIGSNSQEKIEMEENSAYGPMRRN